jgi:hypothetical protein
MDADFSIELGAEDPVLDFPWSDPDGNFAYHDVKRHPELLSLIEETQRFPELAEFLHAINASPSRFESAKCDAWAATELNPEEDIYDASHKFTSYVDVVFSAEDTAAPTPAEASFRESSSRESLPAHEKFVRELVDLLCQIPEIPSAAEVYIRRCYFSQPSGVQQGFYCTLYVHGYGNDASIARQNWAEGLKFLRSAILQLSADSAS